MKKTILNLEGVQILSKKQQKNVNGGLADGGESFDDGKAGCCYLRVGRSPYCGLSMESAKAMYIMAKNSGITDAGWCCASC